MLGHPFYDDYDEYDYSPYQNNGNYYRQRQRAKEEARRRAAIEEYYRQKELEEREARLRQRQEHIRRLKQRQREEAEYRSAYEEAIHRRRETEEEHRRQQLRQLFGVSSEDHDDQSDEDASDVEQEPVYKIVRGPDGRLYRINMNSLRPQQEERRTTKLRSSSAKKENVAPTKAVASKKSVEDDDSVGSRKIPIKSLNGSSQRPALVPKRSLSKKDRKKSKQRVTILVEDASDSETEDDYQSVWRNRRPSPGEWIEPVEDYTF